MQRYPLNLRGGTFSAPHFYRRGGYITVFLLVLLFCTYSPQASAQINYTDYNVDSNSNVDGQANIGSEIEGNLADAQVLEGNYQQITEVNLTDVSAIEDYVDVTSEIDGISNSGNITDFDNMKDETLDSGTFHEGTYRTTWGDTNYQPMETAVDFFRCMGGNFALGSGYRLTGIFISSGVDGGSGEARLSVYQGGTLSNPHGASLVWDAGTVGAADGIVSISGGSASITNNQPLWICIKSNDNTFNVQFDNTHDSSSDFQSTEGRLNLVAHSTDEQVPFDSTIDVTGSSWADYWYSFHITIEAENHLDQEVQFTEAIDFLSSEILAIKTGGFSGSEELELSYWSGSDWTVVTNALAENAWNNYSVSIDSSQFTIRFTGSDFPSDASQDWWEIDAILLVLSGNGQEELGVQNDTSDVDNSPDIGTVEPFSYITAKGSLYADLEESASSSIEFQRASGSNGSLHSIDIGQPGNNRLVAVFATIETSGTSAILITIDGKNATRITEADNPDGKGNHIELWILTESGLGSSAGVVDIQLYQPSALASVHAMVFYNVQDTNSAYDASIDEDSIDQYEILPGPIDIPANGLVISSAISGKANHNFNDNDWDTEPTETTDDNLIPEIEMIEAFEGAPPDGAIVANAYWISDIGYQTDRQLRSRTNNINNRGSGIVASFLPVGYQLDQEFQWNDIPYQQYSETLSIYTFDLPTENLLVDFWDGAQWQNIHTGLAANSWNNVSVTDILVSDSFTIRIRDENLTNDDTLDTWQIDVIMLSYISTNTNYQLQWEHQVDGVDVDRENYELTIFGHSSNASESFQIQLWNSSSASWTEPLAIEIESTLQWYNISLPEAGIIGTSITWRYIGSDDDPFDLEQTTLYIDYAGISVYDKVPIVQSSPEGSVFSEGSVGLLQWTVYDQNPANYTIVYDEEIVQEDTWLGTTIVYDPGELTVGEYTYNLTLQDSYGLTFSDIAVVTIIDTTNPYFTTTPGNYSFSESIGEHFLEWEVYDSYLDSFDLYIDGVLTEDGDLWPSFDYVEIDISGLSKGIYNYTLVVYDESNNGVIDTLFVTVIDTTIPELITAPSDFSYAEDSTGNLIKYNSTDNYPDVYQMYRNGTLVDSGSWDSFINITSSIDGLSIGTYNFTVLIFDDSGNFVISTVIVSVEDMTYPVVLGTSGDVTYAQGFNGNFLWWNASDRYTAHYEIYFNAYIFKSGNWTDKEVILLDVDGLTAGTHNFTARFYDESGNYVENSQVVTVISESINPVLLSQPDNITIFEGSTGNTIQWTASDEFAFIYRLYFNELNVDLNLWTNYSPIMLNIDNLDLGVTNVTIVIYDLSRNTIHHTVFVTVIDNLDPLLTSTPEDVEYVLGTKGNTVFWQADDRHAFEYALLQDGTLLYRNTWQSGTLITISIDNLQLGTYNYTIVMYDTSMNMVFDSVVINVVYIETAVLGISPTLDVFEGYVDPLTGQWLDSQNNSVTLGTTRSSLSMTNGTMLKEFSSVIIDGNIVLPIDYSDMLPGTYTLTLDFQKYAHLNHSLTYIVVVHGHQLDISFEVEEDLVAGENYTISVRVTYNDTAFTSLGLLQSGGRSGPANGITITMQTDLKYTNGTTKSLVYQGTTDIEGYMLFTLSSEITTDLAQIERVGVVAGSQGWFIGTEEELPGEEFPEVTPSVDQTISELSKRIAIWAISALVGLVMVGLSVSRYNSKQKMRAESISKDLASALLEITGLRSIQQVILINEGGLPLYQKHIRELGVDPMLLSGMSSAFSSFLTEVSDQQMFGMQIMEDQGLSITSSKSHRSNLIIISSASLPDIILDQLMDSHLTIEDRFKEKLDSYFITTLPTDEISVIFGERDFKLALTGNLRIDPAMLAMFDKLKRVENDIKWAISHLDGIVDESPDVLLLEDLIAFYQQFSLTEGEIAKAILTAYERGIIIAE